MLGFGVFQSSAIVIKGFWTMHSPQTCHTQAHTLAKMRAHALTDTDRCESVLPTLNMKMKSLMR